MEVFGYLFFSTIEGIVVLSMGMYVFRLNIRKYFLHLFLISLLVSIENMVTRDVLALAPVAPIISILITVLFFNTIIRVPLFWSLVMTLTGFFGYGVIQTATITILFGSAQVAQSTVFNGYATQLVSSLIGIGISWLLYKRGIGFTFEFERLRFRWERYLTFMLIIAFIVLLGVMMYFKDVYVNLLGFIASLIVFLYYSMRKEAAEK